MNQLLQLFLAFVEIGLFTIGGGMASLPLIDEIIVQRHGWLSANEFIDLITISEMTPGPIAINSATFVGNKVAGFLGAIIATMGSILPSIIIVIILAQIYYNYKDVSYLEGALQGIRPAVVALIASAAVGIIILALFQTELDLNLLFTQGIKVAFRDFHFVPIRFIILGIFLWSLRKFSLNPIYLIIAGGVLGILLL